ncbi:aminotransferase class I/II-fold pyridoxal phosphate-dependent enzyme [Halomonas sp. 18H]|uniref:aminotransferase class I/II-fold pyridoxal phosphate-dependent enzyme n=1 Tax=Halomonas almeriensis TaxID=308163 RepID=UPI002231112E|nr:MULTISPECIES: aminotransferase class I/II-fold pyridoxal phosphate-dependent enzyme [Halomonas]MCW4152877.1 aminotransferase class I/II-fold pyridoxal phosphate-dependent enzyme [Halomonas sp. 18H]MDN3554203.1 aminotransferase class I/II-fold pyridoxal phosphate-dependent enzyme [Halomonas almeriensis]
MPRFADHLYHPGPDNPFPGIWVLQRRLGRTIPHRLGSNEGLDMPHAALRRHFGDAMVEHAYCYGDSEALGVRERLSQQQGIPLEALLVDAGADSLLALALRAVAPAGQSVISSAGTYPTFGYFARGQGCRLVEVAYHEDEHGLSPDLQALAEAAHQEEARLVYLANPDNPSGHLHTDDAVKALRRALPEDCWLLLDEAYHDFRPDADTPIAREVMPGVIRCRTLSKAHGMAGMRIGYAIAEPETLYMLMKVRIHYAVSALTLAAAEVVLDHPDETRQHIADVIARREALAEHFRSLGAEVLPSATNFLGIRLSSAELAGQVHGELLAEGKLIARPAHPDLGHVLRISAVADALTPGRLATLERALQDG